MDQIIDADMARAIQIDAARQHTLIAWIIQHDLLGHPGKYVARLTLEHPTVYILIADTLAAIRLMLPPGLDLSPRMHDDQPWASYGFRLACLGDDVDRLGRGSPQAFRTICIHLKAHAGKRYGRECGLPPPDASRSPDAANGGPYHRRAPTPGFARPNAQPRSSAGVHDGPQQRCRPAARSSCRETR
jgi:hypothetical protein